MNFLKKLFKKKVSIEEAIEILDISEVPYVNMHIFYLQETANLILTRKNGKPAFFLDEILNLRDSNHPAIRKVRRNQEMGRDEFVKSVSKTFMKT